MSFVERIEEAIEWAAEHEEKIPHMAGVIYHRLELTIDGLQVWTHCRQYQMSHTLSVSEIEGGEFNPVLAKLNEQHVDMKVLVADKTNVSPNDPRTWGPMYHHLRALVDSHGTDDYDRVYRLAEAALNRMEETEDAGGA